MSRFSVEMLMLPRGETKNKRSHGQIAAWMGENATVTEPDENGIFEIEMETADMEEAIQHAWNAVGGSGTGDHVMLLATDDLPESWQVHAARPPGQPAAS
jgi:hypothetical protein